MREQVVAAAVQLDGVTHSMPRPARHHTVLFALERYSDADLAAAKQGFITDGGRFVDRREGGELAVAAGQIANLRWPPDLYSEDLW